MNFYLQSFLYTVALTFGVAVLGWDAVTVSAQTIGNIPAQVTGGVDFGPFAQNAIATGVMVAGIAIAVVSKFAIGFLASKVHMNDTAAEALLASRVNDVLHRALDYAEAWAKTQVADPNSPIHHVQVNNFFMEQALKFAMASMPDLIKTFNLTEERIKAMLLARLNHVIPVPAVDSSKVNTLSQMAVGLINPSPVPSPDAAAQSGASAS